MECSVCLRSKAGLECSICKNTLCKTCALFLDDESFSFLPKVPDELRGSTYCPKCFDQTVTPQLEDYNHTMTAAKQVHVFLKNQSKESRIYKSVEPPVMVEDCHDPEETLLRLAFLAVTANFNGLVNVDITSKKVRIGGYQTQSYRGIGTPTQIHNEKSLRK